MKGTEKQRPYLTYTVVTPPAHGTLSGTAPNVTYTPATNYIGADNFTFQVNDGALDSTPATVSISVTPIAVDLDIDGVSSGNTFSPGQGGFLAKGGWVMITLWARRGQGNSTPPRLIASVCGERRLDAY